MRFALPAAFFAAFSAAACRRECTVGSYEGACEGNIRVWCAQDKLSLPHVVRDDCAKENRYCAMSESARGAWCFDSLGRCEQSSFASYCDPRGRVVVRCVGDQILPSGPPCGPTERLETKPDD